MKFYDKNMTDNKLCSIAMVKAELLCYGARVEDKSQSALAAKNSGLFAKGFQRAMNFVMLGENVNVCVAEKFCALSPYSIGIDNGEWLYKNGVKLYPIRILALDESNSAFFRGDICLRPHSEKCLSMWPNLSCKYALENRKCKFCSLGCDNQNYCMSESEVLSALLPVIKKSPQYGVYISGGTVINPNYTADYLACIVKEIRKISDRPISVELAPPSDEKIARLYEAGVDELIMNVEIYDEKLRREICPGKSDIPLSEYYRAFSFAVKNFGEGCVSSVLIAGIQPDADVMRGADELSDARVMPTIIPFKPMDESALCEMPRTDPTAYLRLSKYLSDVLRKKNMSPLNQGACTDCGGCSMDTTLAKEAESENGSILPA